MSVSRGRLHVFMMFALVLPLSACSQWFRNFDITVKNAYLKTSYVYQNVSVSYLGKHTTNTTHYNAPDGYAFLAMHLDVKYRSVFYTEHLTLHIGTHTYKADPRHYVLSAAGFPVLKNTPAEQGKTLTASGYVFFIVPISTPLTGMELSYQKSQFLVPEARWLPPLMTLDSLNLQL